MWGDVPRCCQQTSQHARRVLQFLVYLYIYVQSKRPSGQLTEEQCRLLASRLRAHHLSPLYLTRVGRPWELTWGANMGC